MTIYVAAGLVLAALVATASGRVDLQVALQVALRIASDLGVDPVTVLALIGTCVSFTLINPYSHQSNVMVMRPGGYTPAQFARFGACILAPCLVTVCGVTYLLLRS
jgi:di/tricarboxylate transporter